MKLKRARRQRESDVVPPQVTIILLTGFTLIIGVARYRLRRRTSYPSSPRNRLRACYEPVS